MSLTLRKVSLACLCAFLFAPSVVTAQADRPADSPTPPGLLKLQAYGDINCEDLLSRLDHLASLLHEDPEAEAHVFVYDGRVKVARKILLNVAFTEDYLIRQRAVEARRVRVSYGGQREEFTVEPFVVSRGASPPKPAPTVAAPDDARAARKFDEGRFGFDRDARGRAVLWGGADAMCSIGLSPDLAEYAKALRAEPDARAHVLVYGGRGQSYADTNTLSRLIRHRLFNVERIPHRRITLVYGGRRDHSFVELWIVPRGARAPAVNRQ